MAKQPSKKQIAAARQKLVLLVIILGLLALCAVLVFERVPPSPGSAEPSRPEPNPYTAADFGYQDGYLTCLSGESLPGIDVSHHQGDIDWSAVKAAGMEFAMIRVGYRGYEDGVIHADETARFNLTQAKNAGLRVGAYFFSQAVTVEEAREEAAFTVEFLKDFDLDMPVVYDWEYVSEDVRTGAMEPETLVSCVRAFCDAVKDAGYEPVVYFNQELSKTLLDVTEVAAYDFWLAMYSGEMDYPYKLRLWQYTDEGQVPGIEGDVDLDLYFP